MNVLIMPPHLGHSALCQILTYLHVWARHNFDTADCFGSCNNIGDVLDKLRDIRTEITSLPQNGR